MKKVLLLSIFALLGISAVQAQKGVEVTIRNQQVKDTIFEFDVYMERSAGSDFNLGYADIVIDSLIKKVFGVAEDSVFLHNAQFSYVTGSNLLINSDGDTIDAAVYDAAISVQNFRTNPGANGGRLIINMNVPDFLPLQTNFNANVAVISNSLQKIGTFRITGMGVRTFAPYIDFHTTGAGIKTKIYEIANATPWNQTRLTESPQATTLATAATAMDTLFVSAQTTTSLNLTWITSVPADDSVVIVMREYDLANPNLTGEDTSVSNGLNYTFNSDFQANRDASEATAGTSRIGTDTLAHHVVYVGALTDTGNIEITGLRVGVSYKIVAYAVNGEMGFNNAFSAGYGIVTSSVEDEPLWAVTSLFLTAGNTNSQIRVTYEVDTAQKDFATATNDIEWDGKDSILFVAFTSSISVNPTDGKAYGANLAFASGDTLGAGAAYVLGARRARAFPGGDSLYSENFDMTGLAADDQYFVKAFPFRGNASPFARNFYAAGAKSATRWTAPDPLDPTDPDINASGADFDNTGDSIITLTFTNPVSPGTGRIVVVREGGAVNASPVNGFVYIADANFDSAANLVDTLGAKGTGDNRVVYAGTGSSVEVKGLDPNQRYHFAVIEYNGDVAKRNLNYIADGANPSGWLRADRHTWMTVTVSAMLEGAFDAAGDTMFRSLRSTPDLLEADQPFNTADYGSYNGGESITLGDYPNAVDWVLVEVRGVSNGDFANADSSALQDSGAAYVSRRAALLLSDGSIVSPNSAAADNDTLLFQTTTDAEFFVVVYHRNHIPIMSDTAVTRGVNPSFDLTAPATVAGAAGTDFIEVGGKALMYAGNANAADFMIDADDRVAINSDRNTTEEYKISDVNLDRDVDAGDLAKAWNNRDKNSIAKITDTP